MANKTKCLYCGKYGPKRKFEYSEDQQHRACRDEWVRRSTKGMCITCGKERDYICHHNNTLPGTDYPQKD